MTRRPRFFLLVAATLTAGACARVIGVAEYRNVVVVLCDAPCEVPADCAERLSASLAGATNDEVITWLEEFDRRDCASAACNDELLRCFHTAPGLCGESGEACERSAECCGFDDDAPAAGAGCCAGSGSGACCDDCRTCAERVDAFAKGAPFEDAAVCLSQAKSWNELRACAEAKCDIPCAAGEEGCKFCLAKECGSLYLACGNDTGF